jgi:hypothetical protein
MSDARNEYLKKALELFMNTDKDSDKSIQPNYNINLVFNCDTIDKKIYKVLKKYGLR